MTPQEAILIIRRYKELMNMFNVNSSHFTATLDLAIEALKKQTPKMLTHEASLYDELTCPSCKNVVSRREKWGEAMIRITPNFCEYCGQALRRDAE